MNNSSQKVQDIGEQGLLRKLQSFCPSEIVGDDAALVEVTSEHSLVVTTDVLVDGVHFSQQTTTPEDVGWRAAAANLSDLAAMGASPLGITVGLSLPGDVPVRWLESLYEGLVSCLEQYQTVILGGDVCRSPVITVAITALGQVLPNRVIRRYGAQLGDVIVVTGVHGAARAGLELLLNPDFGQKLSKSERKALILAHQRPKPRLDILASLWDLVSMPRIGGMDSSDGLADALIQICQCSRVGARIERDRISLPSSFSGWLSPEQALEWALSGGEDFELVLCLPESPAQALVQCLGNGAAIIGQITAGSEVVLVDSQGIYPQQRLTLTEGFQHF